MDKGGIFVEKKIRWGILGLGKIAHSFAKALKSMPEAELTAVGSRSMEKSLGFADEYHVKHAYGSYEELAKSKEYDVVYIATPHNLHFENTMLCLNANKNVLCEKSFCINALQASQMIELARSKKLFLMEAMWTRFLPVTQIVQNWIKEGRIGEVRMLKADFGFRAPWDPNARYLNKKLAGGALLDVGIYTISYAFHIFKDTPKRITSLANIGETGVDEQASVILGFSNGQQAVLSFAVSTQLENKAIIYGTDGYIEVPDFFGAIKATLYVNGKASETVEIPHEFNGYVFEAREVMDCILEEKSENAVMPLDETLSIMKVMDEMRCSWGLKYDFE